MIYCCHRINTVSELVIINTNYGIEIDIRDNVNGELHLSHDPFIQGELLNTFLKFYNHAFIILNIKSERIEFKIIELLKKYNIINYFFLDSSFPIIYNLINKGEKNIAIRFSEFEDINTVLNMKNKVKWVWVDCFTKNPLLYSVYEKLKQSGFKICFVSPELQNQPDKLKEYRNYFKNNNIILDMICSKSYNTDTWLKQDGIQIIIPMSGIGKRFIDAGYNDPKPIIEIDGKPMIEHVINLFPGENNFSFICNDKHLRETNMKQILENICPSGKIYEVSIENRQGPVHAVSLIFDSVDDDKEVIISYCDYGTYWNYNNFLDITRKQNADGSIACYKGFHPHMLGVDNYAFLQETYEGSMLMKSIQEKKPFTNNKMQEYASNGTYYFKSGAIMKKYFKMLMDKKQTINNEYYVSMVYNLLIYHGLNVKIFEIENMLQWGTPNDLEIYKQWSNYFNDILKKQPIYIDDNTTLILPMAGAGSRFSIKGYDKPKPLLDVCNAPMIIQAVNCLPQTKQKIFICQKEHLQQFNIESILKNNYTNCSIIDINEITQGQACTTEIGIIRSNIGLNSPILISACDNGVYYNKEKYQKMIEDESIDIIVWSFVNNQSSKNNPNMYAWMETDNDNNIISVSCKKFDDSIHNIKTSHVIIGTMFFRKASFFIDGLNKNYDENIRSNGEFYVDDVINQNIKAGLNVKVFEVDYYICWGTPDDYETYLYWQRFFHKCEWHNYTIENDIQYNPLIMKA